MAGMVTLLTLGVAGSTFAEITAPLAQDALKAKITEKWQTRNLKVKVVPYSSSARTRKGQFALISVTADWAERRGKHIKILGLAIAARDVQIDAAQLVDAGELEIVSSKSTSLKGRLMEADINKLLAMKESSIENLRVDFGKGHLTFMGKYRLNIKLTGVVEIKNGYEIHFKPTKASIGILGVPLGIVNQFLKNLNPILDMREVPLKPKLKKLIITPTYLDVIG